MQQDAYGDWFYYNFQYGCLVPNHDCRVIPVPAVGAAEWFSGNGPTVLVVIDGKLIEIRYCVVYTTCW